MLVGALNMDEYAFGFSTENTHYGATRNPHDPTRVAGGSSGGSAAAVAARLVPLTLGSDTNGSIRVPAALCGVFGLRPTFGRLSRAGMRLFASSLDVGGPFARSTEDLALAYDALQGPDPEDPACASRPLQPTLSSLARGVDGLRIAVAEGYYASQGAAEVFAAVERVASALGASERIELPSPGAARAAAMIVTSVEGAELHLERSHRQGGRIRSEDPRALPRRGFGSRRLVRARPKIAALVLPRNDRRVREGGRDPGARHSLSSLSNWPDVDRARGQSPSRGRASRRYTQPLSFAGLPTVVAPVANAGPLPLGVQIVAAPWREDLALRVAAAAEALGAVASPSPLSTEVAAR